MKLSEIRSRFLKFFEDRGHKLYESAPIVPEDKSVLFTVAGMVPFKDFFLNRSTPPTSRATSSQRCIRTNDIDCIGKTARHLTTFEMLGNFSFGDYFKDRAIALGWELVTKELGISEDKLIVTVYKEDEEAFKIWRDLGISNNQLYKLDKDNNFWEMGEKGPCGPSSEIYYAFDGLENFDPDSERFIEIYNMVFMEFNKDNNKLSHLPKKNIDTGLGLERVAMVLQNVETVFDIDVMVPVRDSIRKLTNIINDNAEKIIMDHLRAACFLINDGVRPSNEKQGYILRRLIRRAAKYGNELNLNNFLYKLVDEVAINYDFVKENKKKISEVIKKEEEKFNEVLIRGLEFAKLEIEGTVEETLDPEFVFKLYDTYGFPMELTKDIAEKHGKKVDESDFNKRFKKHQELSRKSSTFKDREVSKEKLLEIARSKGNTNFIGYDLLTTKANLLSLEEREEILEMIFDTTPFYAESGGQVADRGKIISKDFEGEVIDVQKTNGIFVHYVKPLSGSATSKSYELIVDREFREKVKRNHTATHLLHSAVKAVLGENVNQAGSYVDDKRLRLDLSIDRAITKEELVKIEILVNQEIFDNNEVITSHHKLEEAKKLGAIATFEDRYGDEVRVISAGSSKELCGGTHISNTSEIGIFKIVSEKSISSNSRRIEAITSLECFNYLSSIENNLDSISKKLNSPINAIEEKASKLMSDNAEMKNRLGMLESVMLDHKLEDAFKNKRGIIKLELESNLINKLNPNKIKQDGYFIFAYSKEGDISILSSGLNFNLGEVLKEALSQMGKKGGGKNNFARTKVSFEEVDKLYLLIKEKVSL